MVCNVTGVGQQLSFIKNISFYLFSIRADNLTLWNVITIFVEEGKRLFEFRNLFIGGSILLIVSE